MDIKLADKTAKSSHIFLLLKIKFPVPLIDLKIFNKSILLIKLKLVVLINRQRIGHFHLTHKHLFKNILDLCVANVIDLDHICLPRM